jgi:hypothetical protein
MITYSLFKKRCYGTTAMDYCDEYYWTGNYECFLSRPNTNHNYFIYIHRIRNKNFKTVEWSAIIYQTLSCSNSRDIEIGRYSYRTLKGTIEKIVDFINEYDKKLKPEKMIDWMEEVKKPAFIIEDKKISIIGTVYTSAGLEMNNSLSSDEIKKKWLYYHDDLPNYRKYNDFFVISNDWNRKYYIEHIVHFGSGYGSGGVTDIDIAKIGLSREEIIEKTINLYKIYLDIKYIADIRRNC